jgi:acyl transferase domain-containing protein
LDDAFHYLQDNSLVGNHITLEDPPTALELAQAPVKKQIEHASDVNVVPTPRIVLISSHDEKGNVRQATQLSTHFASLSLDQMSKTRYLENLAYTLDQRRTLLPWRSFAVLDSFGDLQALDKRLSVTQKSVPNPSLAFIFTGQGAQYAGMGRELLRYPIFARRLREAEEYLRELGCPWELRKEMFKPAEDSNIDRPDLSQTLCTVLQVALVDLLESFGVRPTAVVGHSSGEIAAAYNAGAISAKAAWKIAYFRGLCALRLVHSQQPKGAMLALGTSKDTAETYIAQVAKHYGHRGLVVACINSPKSVTISGDTDQIEALETIVLGDHHFARKLRVDVAYHSPHMEQIADEYASMLKDIEHGDTQIKEAVMISSVTGARVTAQQLAKAEYWVSNMLSPVQFVDAINPILPRSNRRIRKKIDLSHRNHLQISWLLEVGPHSALQGPLRDIMSDLPSQINLGYNAVLERTVPAVNSCLAAMGQLKCHGYAVSLERVNYPLGKGYRNLMILPDLPAYPFDHSKRYWYESRLSKQFRTAPQHRMDLLGKPVPDWNALEPRWRNVLRVSDMPWIEDHVVSCTASLWEVYILT